MELLFFFLVVMQVKHWLVDFVWQTAKQVQGKGIYGNFDGITHSLEHALATALILSLMLLIIPVPFNVGTVFLMMILDFITHYHIDWAKMNWGNRDIQNPLFWNHLGLDQMAHHLIYFLMAAILFA